MQKQAKYREITYFYFTNTECLNESYTNCLRMYTIMTNTVMNNRMKFHRASIESLVAASTLKSKLYLSMLKNRTNENKVITSNIFEYSI